MSLVSTDSHVRAILSTIKNRPELPMETWVLEAIGFLRNAPTILPRSEKLISARASLANDRSKMVASKIKMLRELSLLRGAKFDVESFILNKYTSYLAQYKNVRSREAVVDYVLTPISKRIRKIESALERLEEIIKDFDSRAWAIRDVISALQFGEREA